MDKKLEAERLLSSILEYYKKLNATQSKVLETMNSVLVKKR